MCDGYGERAHTRVCEAVSCQVVALNKPHVTHGTSVRFHTWMHRALRYYFCSSHSNWKFKVQYIHLCFKFNHSFQSMQSFTGGFRRKNKGDVFSNHFFFYYVFFKRFSPQPQHITWADDCSLNGKNIPSHPDFWKSNLTWKQYFTYISLCMTTSI